MKKIFSLLTIAMVSLPLAKAESGRPSDAADDGISHKWEVKTALGGMFTNYEGSSKAGNINFGESLSCELGLGYNLNSNLYVGVSSGYFYSYGLTAGIAKDNQLIPALGDVVYRWNQWEKCSLFAEARAGYLFNLLDKQKRNNVEDYDPSGYVLLEVMPGVYCRLQENIDVSFSLGFTYGISTEPKDLDYTNNEVGVAFKIGINFRSSSKKTVRTALEK